MDEIALVTSLHDTAGISVVDFQTGTSVCSALKNNICNRGAVCVINGLSSFSGNGSCDYIAAAQYKKPVIHIWHWNKPQVLMQCHCQQIITALSCDPAGSLLIGGSKEGKLYCWEVSTGELLHCWSAHYKAITRIQSSLCGRYFSTCSEDGNAKVWEYTSIFTVISSDNAAQSRGGIQAYRSWSPHSLSVMDMVLSKAITSLRVFTCSLDRAIVIYDVHNNIQCFSLFLPISLESIVCNSYENKIFVGSSSGVIFFVDMSIACSSIDSQQLPKVSFAASSDGMNLPKGVEALVGHSRCVSSLGVTLDDSQLLSASEDGCIRVWDIVTTQCLREFSPLNKSPLSSILLLPRPEHLLTDIPRPALAPLGHLKKYSTPSTAGGVSTLAMSLIGGASRRIRDNLRHELRGSSGSGSGRRHLGPDEIHRGINLSNVNISVAAVDTADTTISTSDTSNNNISVEVAAASSLESHSKSMILDNSLIDDEDFCYLPFVASEKEESDPTLAVNQGRLSISKQSFKESRRKSKEPEINEKNNVPLKVVNAIDISTSATNITTTTTTGATAAITVLPERDVITTPPPPPSPPVSNENNNSSSSRNSKRRKVIEVLLPQETTVMDSHPQVAVHNKTKNTKRSKR